MTIMPHFSANVYVKLVSKMSGNLVSSGFCQPYVLSNITTLDLGAQWLSGRVLDSRQRGLGLESH